MSRRRRRTGPGSARGANRGGPRRRVIITSVEPRGDVIVMTLVEEQNGW